MATTTKTWKDTKNKKGKTFKQTEKTTQSKRDYSLAREEQRIRKLQEQNKLAEKRGLQDTIKSIGTSIGNVVLKGTTGASVYKAASSLPEAYGQIINPISGDDNKDKQKDKKPTGVIVE